MRVSAALQLPGCRRVVLAVLPMTSYLEDITCSWRRPGSVLSLPVSDFSVTSGLTWGRIMTSGVTRSLAERSHVCWEREVKHISNVYTCAQREQSYSSFWRSSLTDLSMELHSDFFQHIFKCYKSTSSNLMSSRAHRDEVVAIYLNILCKFILQSFFVTHKTWFADCTNQHYKDFF